MSNTWGMTSDPADDWRKRAACKDEDPELFFNEGLGYLSQAKTDAAKEVCRRCPVTDQCLAWALAIGDDWAVCGGTTPAERRGYRNRRERVLAEQFPPVPELTQELPGVKDRPRRPGPKKKTHCVNGHSFEGANIYIDCRGFQACRACHADRSRARRAVDREAKRAEASHVR